MDSVTPTNDVDSPAVNINYSVLWQNLSEAMRETGECAAAFNEILRGCEDDVPAEMATLEKWTLDKVNNTLVVSINGGVNTGKSTVFNILCGKQLSPTAAVPTTRHPLAAAPHVLDPKDLTVRDLLPPSQHIVVSDTVPAAVCDACSPEAIYIVQHECKLGFCLLIDCPDYNSVELKNRERSRAIARKSDAILLVLTTQSAFEDTTADFFCDVHDKNKLIVPVVVDQSGAGQSRELIDGFCEYLRKHRNVLWKPNYAMNVGRLDPAKLERPSPEFVKPISGFEELKINDPNDRARIKHDVWENESFKALERTVEYLNKSEKKYRELLDRDNQVEKITRESADSILRDSFPLGELTKIVWAEILAQCDPFTKRVIQAQERFGIHLKKLTRDVVGKLERRKRPSKGENQQEAAVKLKNRYIEKIEKWQKKTKKYLENSDFTDADNVTAQTAEMLKRHFEENYGDREKMEVFKKDVRDHVRQWLANKGRRWFIRIAFPLMTSIMPIVLMALALAPGFLATEFVLAGFLGPAIMEALRKYLDPVIVPVSKNWIEQEKPAVARIIKTMLPTMHVEQVDRAKRMADCVPRFKVAAEKALARLEDINGRASGAAGTET